MKKLLVFALILAFASLAAAQYTDLGTFTCPSGQVEDTQCAASCCAQYNGEYSYSDESCMVQNQADWPQVVQCEQANNCCKSAGGSNNGYMPSTSSPGCCGAAILLLAFGFTAALNGNVRL